MPRISAPNAPAAIAAAGWQPYRDDILPREVMLDFLVAVARYQLLDARVDPAEQAAEQAKRAALIAAAYSSMTAAAETEPA